MGKFLLIVGTIMSAVNIALFILWWSLIRVEATEFAEESQFVLNTISVQIAILESVLAAVGIGLAVLGVFGYQTIKDAAVEKSLEKTSKETQDFLNKFKSSNGAGPAGGKVSGGNMLESDNISVEKESGGV